jgi:hypothetical protein
MLTLSAGEGETSLREALQTQSELGDATRIRPLTRTGFAVSIRAGILSSSQ